MKMIQAMGYNNTAKPNGTGSWGRANEAILRFESFDDVSYRVSDDAGGCFEDTLEGINDAFLSSFRRADLKVRFEIFLYY
jgi:hypothetical protein